MLSTSEQALRMPDALTSIDGLRKRILHLRWIGMDDEAERLCASLARTASQDTIVIGPRDTD